MPLDGSQNISLGSLCFIRKFWLESLIGKIFFFGGFLGSFEGFFWGFGWFMMMLALCMVIFGGVTGVGSLDVSHLYLRKSWDVWSRFLDWELVTVLGVTEAFGWLA